MTYWKGENWNEIPIHVELWGLTSTSSVHFCNTEFTSNKLDLSPRFRLLCWHVKWNPLSNPAEFSHLKELASMRTDSPVPVLTKTKGNKRIPDSCCQNSALCCLWVFAQLDFTRGSSTCFAGFLDWFWKADSHSCNWKGQKRMPSLKEHYAVFSRSPQQKTLQVSWIEIWHESHWCFRLILVTLKWWSWNPYLHKAAPESQIADQ